MHMHIYIYIYESLCCTAEINTILLLIIKCRSKEINWERTGKKKPGLKDSGSSQTMQIAKDAKTRKFTIRKVFFEEKVIGVVGQPLASPAEGWKGDNNSSDRSFFKETKPVTQESLQEP